MKYKDNKQKKPTEWLQGVIAVTVAINVHCVQKKTPTHVFFYISMENVQIFTKFSGNV